MNVIVDTDMGVDDAAAVVWLFAQSAQEVSVLAIGSVAGNAPVEHVAGNVHKVLSHVEGTDNIPISLGADAPLSRPLSRTTAVIHGPDGLWGRGDVYSSDTTTDEVPPPHVLYPRLARTHDGVVLVAPGPLTNIAKAWREDPDGLQQIDRLVVLGGAVGPGNTTPVAEFNVWADPEAADVVLSAPLPVELIPFDAFRTFTITPEDVERLRHSPVAGARLMADPLETYVRVQIDIGGFPAAALPDVAAVQYALAPSRGETVQARVYVDTSDTPTRGQTVVARSTYHRAVLNSTPEELSDIAERAIAGTVDLAAEIQSLAARRAPNVAVIESLDVETMYARFMEVLG